MNWRVIWIGILFLGLLSCDSFVLKKENKDDIVKDGLNKLNWHDVEQPPFFDSCKNTAEEELEICFQQTITQHIQEHLAKQSFSIDTAIEDPKTVKFYYRILNYPMLLFRRFPTSKIF